MAGVTLQNVTKRFGNVVAVNNASLEIKDKEFIVLVGPSGCGKTTLLRCVAGLESIDSGDILLNGESIKGLTPNKRNVRISKNARL